MAKNIKSLQLLRNGKLFDSYAAAVAGITETPTDDGVIKLARYTDEGEDPYSGGTSGNVKTIFGIYHTAFDDKAAGYTIYESYKEVIEAIKEKIDTIAGGGEGSIAQQIEAALNALDYTSYVTGDSKVVTNVTETDGKVAADGKNIANIKLADYTKGEDASKVAATDTLGQALSKLEKQLEVVSANTANAISGLDYSDSAVAGEYVSQVTETNGVINVTRVALPSITEVHEAGKPIIAVSENKGQLAASAGTINAEFVNVADAKSAFTATTVEDVLAEIDAAYKAADAAIVGDATESGNTLGKLEGRIEALDADAKEYSIKQITTGLSTNVKEAWGLFDADNNQSGATINIYKDNTLKSVELVDQALQFTYIVDSGESVVSVDVSKFLAESEFASGVTVNSDGVAHGVVDPTSETFLTVGANGFKLAGVQAAIDAASGDVKSKLDELSGKTVTGVEMTGGTAAIAAGDNGTKKITINTDGSQIKATGYAKGTDSSAIAATDTINAALAKLENQAAAAKTTVAKDAAASHITLSSTTGSNGETVYTIGESDIASKSDLDAEIAARKAVEGQNGDTYAKNTSANYISGATSLNDADVKLDAAIKALEGAAQTEIDAIEDAVGLNANGEYVAGDGHYTSAATTVADAVDKLDDAVKDNADDIAELSGKTVTGITMNGTGVTVTNNVAALTARYTNTAAENENGMVITTDANGGLTFQFGTLDCGEYA